jgi:hypothetical protein
MIMDTQETFAGSVAADGTRTGQAITATAISANVLDTRNAATPALADEGISGTELWLVVQAITAAAGGDAAKTLTITLESDVAASLASAPVVHFTSKAITGAQITAGATLVRTQLPSDDYKRYMGLRFTVSAGFTAFAVFGFLTMDVQRNVIYPSGFTIDV